MHDAALKKSVIAILGRHSKLGNNMKINKITTNICDDFQSQALGICEKLFQIYDEAMSKEND